MSAIRRTVHACVQCRDRKTKCGGITDVASCVACSSRGVKCSFEDEARDPRFNPYLRVRSRDASDRPEDTRRQQTPDLLSELRQLRGELDELKSRRLPTPRLPSRGDQDQEYPIETSDPTWAQAVDTGETISPSLLLETNHPYAASFPNPSQAYGNLSQFPDISHEPSAQAIISAGSSNERFNQPFMMDHSLRSLNNSTLEPARQAQPALTSQPSPDTPFNGPMRVLQELGANDGFDVEVHDPIARQIITAGEASMAHRTFFEHCHINAPFLDPIQDADMTSVRSRSMALMLNIIVAAARFWSHKSRRDTWLHPRYTRLVGLLDSEMSRLTLRPRPADVCLETVQAWMIYSHWMPIDVVGPPTSPNYRSRFSESSVWQCMGLAIRWATLLGLDQTAHLPFLDEGKTPTPSEIQSYRTMLYLTESDHYLALSARRPSTLSPLGVCQALPRFLSGNWTMATDARLASLMRVVEASYVMGARADSEESIEAFNMDVNEIEKFFFERSSGIGPQDKMRQHFPFTSLRWYRLAFASTLLPAMSNWGRARESMRLSVDWASQILYHLSSAATSTPFNPESGTIQGPLEPDATLVALLSFAIDQYFVVIAYTAAFLVLAWQNGAIDNELGMLTGIESAPAQSCTLFRLVDLASRTLRQCAPARGHPATRYADFLSGMTKIITAEPVPAAGRSDAQATLDAGGFMRDQDWLDLWQDSGLDQNWLFGTIGDVP